jgi:hypothetical protein
MDINPVQSGHPGDPVHAPAREQFTPFGIGAWLDTAAGQAQIAAHNGDRYAAQAAMEEQAQADEAWRRKQAELVYERNPDRYPGGVAEAKQRVGAAPAGGPTLAGTSAEIEAMSRRCDPRGGGFRVVAPEVPDTSVAVGTQMDAYGRVIDDPALTQAPWTRSG